MEGDDPVPDTFTARKIAETVKALNIEQLILNDCRFCRKPNCILCFDPSSAITECEVVTQCTCTFTPLHIQGRVIEAVPTPKRFTIDIVAKLMNLYFSFGQHFLRVMRTTDDSFAATVACSRFKECVTLQDDDDDDTNSDNDENLPEATFCFDRLTLDENR